MKIQFLINNQPVSVNTEPYRRLVDILREDLGLTGTKRGCGSGKCGACHALVNDKLVNTCMVPAFSIEGARVQTIEGLADTRDFMMIEDAFSKAGVVLCGFCAPGLVMATEALLNINSNPSEDEIREAISGNTCRCTGYQNIVKGIQEAVKFKRKRRYARKR